MTNYIGEMTDQEKSILLAKVMGWDVGEYGVIFPTAEDIGNYVDTGDGESLYDPANMALAWRVLNWAHAKMWIPFSLKSLAMPPADAQRLFLDKILELAIEAGIAEVE